MLAMVHPLAPPTLAPPPISLLDALMHDALALDHACALPGTRAHLASTAEAHTVSVAAPGLAASDVVIEAHPDGRLTIRGQNKNKRKLDCSIAMPRDADVEAASAEVADGLITVSVKRAKATTVAIGVGTEAIAEAEEEEGAYTMSVVAAGFAASDLALSVEGGVLTVKGTSTRTGARLERHARLPRDAHADGARASHVDGILTVCVPTKPAASEPRRIPINVAAVAAPVDTTAHAKATETEEMEDEAVMV